MKEIVQKNEIGSIQYIYSNRLNFGTFRKKESVLWDFGPHDVSIILSLLNQHPEYVYATGTSFTQSNIDSVNMNLSFKNDITANIFLSWYHPVKEQKFVVVGSSGMLTFDDTLPFEEKLTLKKYKSVIQNGIPIFKDIEETKIMVEKGEPLKNECKHFIECITYNVDPLTDANESVEVLKIIDAAERSMQLKSSIKL